MKTDPKSIKLVILSGIRRSLIDLGSATKAELSDKLEISFPTISKFLSQMEKEGEILSAGLDESSGGRRAKRYTYNPDYMLGLAIFLERTETNYAIFNCAGEVKEQGTVQSVLTDGGLHLLTSSIEGLLMANQAIRSLSIGVPGSVKNGRIFYIPGYEQFQDFDIKGYYENLFSMPVVVENDMNAAVLGYHHYKGIKDHQSLVYLYSGQNGPGAGFMINGDVVRGNTFFAGEVSFVPQYDDFNFREALENGTSHKEVLISGSNQIDAISRLVASITAIINPHTFIFCKDEVGETLVEKIAAASSKYIPAVHLPVLAISDWKQDYLYGLQSLGLALMLDSPEKYIRK
ncbi:ROK family protein [Cytobacillus firmus]|uniref:ROK family protein n=1 Tax=Cytobacillus firmus TaxID=1399 RepID=A0AA46PTL8_CYTFI|nr:ROK family protein [Cytobacillus firmus]UYG97530.1 ROK family protein [Cytobacillus firmus]